LSSPLPLGESEEYQAISYLRICGFISKIRCPLRKLRRCTTILLAHYCANNFSLFAWAGYYSYLWADVITADAFGAFTEAGGPYDRKVAERLRKYIFSVGNTIDPAEAYRNFRGRDPKVEALMKKRGFTS